MRLIAENQNGKLGINAGQVQIIQPGNIEPIKVESIKQGAEFLMCPGRFTIQNHQVHEMPEAKQ